MGAELLVRPAERKELPWVLGTGPELLVVPRFLAHCLDLQLVFMHPRDAGPPAQLAVAVGVGPMDAEPVSLGLSVDRGAVGEQQQ